MPHTFSVPVETPIGEVRLNILWNADSAVDALSAYGVRLRDPSPFWKAAGRALRESYRKNFEAGGRPAWTPLKLSTVQQKAAFLAKKPRPPFTKSGKVPLRLLQRGRFGARTILIKRGRYRDSWVLEGAAGHVEQVSPDGRSLFVGSQLMVEQTLSPDKPLKRYHRLTKKALAARGKGKTVTAKVSLAVLHEEGTQFMPARKNAVVQAEDVESLRRRAILWIDGELNG